jgi:hypothetical protein
MPDFAEVLPGDNADDSVQLITHKQMAKAQGAEQCETALHRHILLQPQSTESSKVFDHAASVRVDHSPSTMRRHSQSKEPCIE